MRRIALLWLIFSAGPAAAQFLPADQSVVRFTRYQAVSERALPGYAAVGLPVGSLTLFPSVDLSSDYNDNVLALAVPRASDVFFRTEPAAQLESNWTQGSLNISADVAADRYTRMTSENKEAIDLTAYGTKDLGPSTRVRLLGRFDANRESRESQNAFALSLRPVRYQTETGALGVTQSLNHIELIGEAGYRHDKYFDGQLPDGSVFSQQYRNADQLHLQLRSEYAQSTALAYFAQVSYDETYYSQRTPFGLERNSRNTEALGGIRFELPVLARGEIGIGYLTSSYRDAALRSFSGLAISTDVSFFPTQLLTVTVSAERKVNDDGLPNSSGYNQLDGGVQVDYEVLRKLVVGVHGRLERDAYNGIDRRDSRAEAGASAQYRLRNGWDVRINYDYLNVQSNGFDRYKSFLRNRVTVGLAYRI